MAKIYKDFFNKNVLIVGYGVSGKGAEIALKHVGASVYILDESKDKTIITQKFVQNFDCAVVSPSISLAHKIYRFAEICGIEVMSEVELGARLYRGTLIGITGTNGKTTTARLLGDMLTAGGLSTCVCGNIGYSFAQSVVEEPSDYAVVELSSFQLEQMGTILKPCIAMITNISPDHLDRHGNMDAYASAKKNIANNQTASDTLLLSYDDIPIEYLNDFTPKSNVLYVSVKECVKGAYLQDGNLYYKEEAIVRSDAIALQGLHNISNALFCIAAAKILGVSNDAIRTALMNFKQDCHRIAHVATKYNKQFFNDSKGTNIGATLAAARTMRGITALILGGKDKGYDFDVLFKHLPSSVRYCFCIGETANLLIESATRSGYPYAQKADSLEEAVRFSIATDAQNVLLSPACSSFDSFKDYKDRGEQFEEIVKNVT